MRINGSSSTGMTQKSQASGKKRKTSARGRSKNDRVQVSDAETLRAMAKTMLVEMPEVRLDKIEGLRDALEKDLFQCDSKKVATQIVRNALAERSW